MRATAKLRHLTSDNCKHIIVRNLSRILDIRILDIDIENRTLYFVYDNMVAFEKAKKELFNIGYPILKCNYQVPPRTMDLRGNDQVLCIIPGSNNL